MSLLAIWASPPTIYKFNSSILFAASLINLKLHTPSRWPHSVLKHRTRNFFCAHSVAPIVRIMTLNTEFIKFTWKSPGHKQTLHHSKRHVRDIDSTLPPPASEQALAPAPVHPPEEMREVKKENTLDSNLSSLTIFLHYEHKIRLVHMVLYNGIINTQNMFEKIDLTFKSQFSQSMSMQAGHAQGLFLTRRLPSSVLKACLYWLTPEEDE